MCSCVWVPQASWELVGKMVIFQIRGLMVRFLFLLTRRVNVGDETQTCPLPHRIPSQAELGGGPERGHQLAPQAPGSRRKCPAPRPTSAPPCFWFWGADFLLARSSLPIRVSQPHNDLTVLGGLFGRLLRSLSPGPSTSARAKCSPPPFSDVAADLSSGC